MTIGPGIHVYGIILISGAMIGAYVASVEATRRGLDPNYVWDGLIWGLLGGIVGARIWHILTPPPSMVAQGFTTAYYLDFNNWVPVVLLGFKFSLPAALALPNGGLGIPGGVLGGVFGLWLYTLRYKLHFPTWLDLGAPGLAIAQAIGRWGNFVNNELYGLPTDLPWAVYIPPESRLAGYAQFERFHPLFLYESILNLLICLGLLYIARRYSGRPAFPLIAGTPAIAPDAARKGVPDHGGAPSGAGRLKPGDLFLIYLILYPTVRFVLEFIRLDSSGFGNLNINQTLSALTAIVGVVALVIRHRRQRRVRSVTTA